MNSSLCSVTIASGSMAHTLVLHRLQRPHAPPCWSHTEQKKPWRWGKTWVDLRTVPSASCPAVSIALLSEDRRGDRTACK